MNLPAHICETISIIRAAGFSAYLVGGCVRDIIMGKEPHDYDVTTNALPDEIEKLFSEHRLILTGKKHGTVAVVICGETVEITTYRIDGNYIDSRHPESVSFTDRIEDDLARRDFTVNAIAMDESGKCIDPFGGRKDIKNKIIRCVGDPDARFTEDALRILRALRFSACLGFSIDQATADAIHRHRQLLSKISAERIQCELFKTLVGVNAPHIVSEYIDVFRVFMPFADNPHDIEKLDSDIPLRLAFLLHEADRPDAALTKLRVPNAVRNEVLCILSNYTSMPADMPSLRRFVGNIGFSSTRRCCLLAQCLGVGDMKQLLQMTDEIEKKKLPCRVSDLDIGGRALLALGFSGRAAGRVLDILLDRVLHDDLENNAAALTDYAHSLIGKV